jgi:hypothetical protein
MALATLAALPAVPAAAAGTPLVGTFSIAAGSCSGGTASGTYLRMVLSGGTNSGGPYFSNSDSSCSDNSYTPLAPGSAGGLITGSYQAAPSPAFDSAGNALADQITAPVPFEGVKFATATNPVDPQTGLHVPAPSIVATGDTLSGSIEAFAVTWNNQQFNQGSPKPGGGSPGNTTPVTGTYNPATGAYVLQWSSQVVGGPFNGFSAFWNLTGIFRPAAGSSGSASPSSVPTGLAAPSATAAPPSGSSSSANSATKGTSSAPVTSPGVSSGTGTTSTTQAPTDAVKPSASKERYVLASHTVLQRSSGWDVPVWLVVLLALLVALGVAGVIWSEKVRRAQGATP